MAITSAFQADDAGSIPAARSKFHLSQYLFRTLETRTLDVFFLNLAFAYILTQYLFCSMSLLHVD